MRCRSCTTDNPTGNRFCESCGTQLQLACARCGHDVNLLARFCGNCGGSLVAAAPPVKSEAPPKWGELKQATVLFADIVGSTDLVAHMDPEEAMARLRPAVLRMRHSVERFGGTVLRTLGDGVMAMFGVPRALEGHALLACQAALHMQAAFAQGGEGLKIRVGLHSGQVASDPEDAEDGRGGGAHGVTIHLASRVIALAQPGGICITDACRTAAGPGCETEAMGPHQLKGIPGPVQIVRLTGAVTGAPHRPLTPETTFRGRKREIDRLIAALDGASNKQGRAIGVAGEPGAGKSRLCQEFLQVCRTRGVPVHEVRAQLYGHALPLQPILELFRVHFFGVASGDSAAVVRERIDACFLPVTSSASDLQLLHEFFGVASTEAEPLAQSPRARQARLLALVRELMRLQSDTLRVIMIEDLHWLDEASEEFATALVAAAAQTRTLLLLNYRGTYRAPWAGSPSYEQVDLAELPGAHMDALVAELLAPITPLPDICHLVCRRAGGNPFFAEELVRTLAESKLIAADTGLPVGGLEAVERALPATIEAVIGARLDRIGEPEKTLLQMCAIIGKEIPLAVLEHVATPIANQIQIGLEGLCQAGLIVPQPAEGGRRFAFRHPLIQEVAYGTQFRIRRGAVHANVAAAMELYYHDQIDEYANLIAYHFEQAEHHDPAARYYARSATWLGSTLAAQAIRHWWKVRSLLEKAESTPDVDRRRATAGAKIAVLGWREGMTLAETKPLIDEALQFAKGGDDRLVPWLLNIEGRMLVASGGPADGYVDCVRRALLYIDIDRDIGRNAVVHASLCQAYGWAGLLKEALAANDVARAGMDRIDPFDREFIGFSIEIWVLNMRARLLTRMGRAHEAAACLEEALHREKSSAHVPLPGMRNFAYIELAQATNDPAMAELHAEQAARSVEKLGGAPYVATFAHGYRALALALKGEHGAALAAFRQGLEIVRKSTVAMEYETELLAGMAECQLRIGDYAQAHAHAGEAIELARKRTTRIAECRALIARAAAARMLGDDSAQVHEDIERARELIEQTGAAILRGALDEALALSAARAA
ncbi:MAG TPA: AAA family ATPase [Ramlibacter sp.]|nr:AAA family ATPase [Ramlibacter sp.]